MKKLSFSALAFAGLLAATSAAAQDGKFYGDVGLLNASHTYDDSTIPKYNLQAVRFNVGYDLLPEVAIEGFLALGMGSQTNSIIGVPITEKLKSISGVYVKGKWNATPELQLYGRLGFASTEIKISNSYNYDKSTSSNS